ncbi:hydroxyisourate hydrolase [Roseibium algae]|uniref:5-hydroxyisourate hydrolase n=1 Tax=Roseibium algae TaxID=3123038 RepID=A0ABU8TP09_9HYPH
MGRLTTHVLDTARGCPAEGLEIELWSMDGMEVKISSHKTNSDGRIDGPILDGEAFKCGTYELRFHAGAYVRLSNPDIAEPLFLDVIPIRFGIGEQDSHYHVPLLLSPFGYSTYRGS